MGTQGTGRKRSTKKERSTAEDDALNLIAREAEARLAAKRAARAEAREIRMKELERQQKELSDEDERMSVGSRGSVRSDLDAVGAYGGGSSNSSKKSKKKKKHKHKDKDRNGYDDDYSVISSRSSRLSDESRVSRSSRLDLTNSRLSDDSRLSRASRLDLQPASYASSDLYSFNGLSSSRIPGSTFNGYQSSLYEDSLCSGSRRVTGSSSHPLEYSSYRSSGSRASSRTNSARTSPVVEDRDYLEKGSRAASALTATTLTSLGGSSSRRGSGETAITVDAETSLREIKDTLAEVEEKYRKAMVSNAQLDNEKNNLMYQVDTLKDSLMELEELLSESRREYEEKVKECEREKHAYSVLQFQFNEMKETLKQSEELLNEIRQLRMKQEGFVREISDLQETVEWKDKKIGALERQKEYTDAIRIERDELREEVVKLKDILKKHGIVLGPDLNINGDIGETPADGSPSEDPASLSTQDSQTPTEGNSMLEIRLRKLVDEREKMIEQVKKLKAQLDEKTQKNGTDNTSSPDGEILENGNDPNILEMQRDSSRQISELKFKLVKAEQEVTALEQNVTRLEGQVTRYKSAAENAEKVEDELKAEKRKLQRELRSALDKVDELESNNSHLSKRLEKMKSTRGMAQTP
ncbi:leucine-rich repeat flightless-interacting protein 2 isoform X3 [Cheilinus undulatus]|uniref:leucine-rich repeat flightless-interacting protein 2 isoform X3 n=1 Tax=Cheilinus undulatus TaxID=241271 RepID=UPI001BD5AD97|nr:leucine-rich repeat flightless-interacting protein 2 isoform X3 [Cheilinus undulatus]